MQPLHLGGAELVGQSAELVGVGHRGPLARLAGQRSHAFVAEICAVRIARASVQEHAQADPAAAGVGEALHVLLVHADLARHGLLHPGLGVVGARRLRGLHGALCDAFEVGLAHAAVPPTVSAWMRTCGWPTPAATRWPALPQNPVAINC